MKRELVIMKTQDHMQVSDVRKLRAVFIANRLPFCENPKPLTWKFGLRLARPPAARTQETSPPMPAIWTHQWAVIGRTVTEAERNYRLHSGAMVSFIAGVGHLGRGRCRRRSPRNH